MVQNGSPELFTLFRHRKGYTASCIYFQLSDELTFAQNSMASQLELLCQYKIRAEAVETENSSDTEAQQKEETLKAMQCDQQCNQKGDCINRVCKCYPGMLSTY